MSLTLADWIPVLRPHLGETLLPPQVRRSILELSDRLPGTCLAALEMSLHDPRRGADLSVRVRTPAEARALTQDLVRELASNPALSYLPDFFEHWATRARWRERAPELWLELDLARRQAEELPPPVICARLAPGVPVLWVSRELLPRMHGRPVLPTAQQEAVEQALERLPPSARLLYVFSLRSRLRGESMACPDADSAVGPDSDPEPDADLAPVRLEVGGLDADEMSRYVGHLARNGSTISEDAWRRAIDDLAPLIRCAGRNHLSVDLAPGIQPRMGVELSFPRLPDREPGWQRLFDLLEERGFLGSPASAAQGRRRAVFDWPGWDSFWTATPRWPVEAGAGYCVRSLSHVKVVTGPGRSPEAKVYLLFGLWRRDSGEPDPR